MEETEATNLLSTQSDQGVQPLQFTKDESYTTFRAEHAFEDDDIVFHFFNTKEHEDDRKYWKDTFPTALSDVAQEVFKAGYPRLKAAWTEEVESWWLRCTGFANEGLPEERIKRFYKELDQSLDARKIIPPRT